MLLAVRVLRAELRRRWSSFFLPDSFSLAGTPLVGPWSSPSRSLTVMGNMSGHVRTRSKSAGRRDDRESSQAVGPVVAQQPSDEQPQLEEPPTEGQDIIPAQDIDDEGAPTVQGPDVEAAQQELTLLKTVDEPGDGPDVAEEILPSLEPLKMPEAGEGKPQI
uniref:GAGE domain-containing protein n=2 Tax=Equus asinus TaxID=9793 RepID=A0A8C4PPV4_EQUAS